MVLGISVVLVGCGTEPMSEGMLRVDGRTFAMGTDSAEVPGLMQKFGVSSPERFAPELPRHKVTVADFELDVTDVTNRAFHRFVLEHPEWSRVGADTALHNGRYLEHWTDSGPAPSDLERPVTFVTWFAAAAYCDWRSGRLPTEAEWELAAGNGDPGQEFPWGSEMPSNQRVSWSGGGHLAPMPVASYSPTGEGFYDLAGNVWKFLADPWRNSYDDTGTPPDSLMVRRTVRGGSYEANATNLRVRYRDSHRPFDAREMVGFRCARSVGKESNEATADSGGPSGGGQVDTVARGHDARA